MDLLVAAGLAPPATDGTGARHYAQDGELPAGEVHGYVDSIEATHTLCGTPLSRLIRYTTLSFPPADAGGPPTCPACTGHVGAP